MSTAESIVSRVRGIDPEAVSSKLDKSGKLMPEWQRLSPRSGAAKHAVSVAQTEHSLDEAAFIACVDKIDAALAGLAPEVQIAACQAAALDFDLSKLFAWAKKGSGNTTEVAKDELRNQLCRIRLAANSSGDVTAIVDSVRKMKRVQLVDAIKQEKVKPEAATAVNS